MKNLNKSIMMKKIPKNRKESHHSDDRYIFDIYFD